MQEVKGRYRKFMYDNRYWVYLYKGCSNSSNMNYVWDISHNRKAEDETAALRILLAVGSYEWHNVICKGE